MRLNGQKSLSSGHPRNLKADHKKLKEVSKNPKMLLQNLQTTLVHMQAGVNLIKKETLDV